MIDPKTYADKQMELCAEFAQYVVDHPEVDDLLPAKSHIFFEVEGEPEFSQFSRMLSGTILTPGIAGAAFARPMEDRRCDTWSRC